MRPGEARHHRNDNRQSVVDGGGHPQHPARLFSALSELEGETIEIIQAAGQPNARTLWVPSLRALFGGVFVFAGVHVWVADTASREQRETWVRNLDALAALCPSIVVPGHLAEGAALDASAIAYTRDYLLAFEEELAKARDSAALIGAMKQRYPKAGMGVALDIGAKVAKGEMKWG